MWFLVQRKDVQRFNVGKVQRLVCERVCAFISMNSYRYLYRLDLLVTFGAATFERNGNELNNSFFTSFSDVGEKFKILDFGAEKIAAVCRVKGVSEQLRISEGYEGKMERLFQER